MKTNTTPATPMESFLDKFRRARNAGTPLFSISCFDPAATMSRLQSNIAGATDAADAESSLSVAEKSSIPLIQWDIIDGWRHRNKAGAEAIDEACNKLNAEQAMTINPVESLKIALALPDGSIVFMMNAHHFIEQGDFLQALWNTRDDFKSRQCSVILVGPDVTIPAQLQHDIFVIDEPLPTEQELRAIIKSLIEGTSIKLSKEAENDAVDALRGLSAFPAEQSVAMNMRKAGLDITGLWERKQKLISSTPGLRVYDGPEKFADIGGCDQIKRFMNGVINGKDSPNAIVFIDEGEKMFAGAVGDVGDSSGVSQDFLGTTLSYMEDNEADGAIFYGPPGAAKSAVAKATGNEAGVPTIMLDLGGMKGGLVGKSEAQIRNAFKVITAVAGGRVFFVMTCNKIVELPPELRRRFTSGIFFFDLPTKAERDLIWPLYIKKYGLEAAFKETPVNDEGWTGAEIRNCCRLAYRQEISLAEAAKYIVPVSKSAASQIQQLRRQASGAYLSANEDGVYEWADPTDKKAAAAPRRTLNLED
jgi:hypothetical protein